MQARINTQQNNPWKYQVTCFSPAIISGLNNKEIALTSSKPKNNATGTFLNIEIKLIRYLKIARTRNIRPNLKKVNLMIPNNGGVPYIGNVIPKRTNITPN